MGIAAADEGTDVNVDASPDADDDAPGDAPPDGADGLLSMLTGGTCTSQVDCGGPSYDEVVFCNPTTCGISAGVCTAVPTGCDNAIDYVCGCDGFIYRNACSAMHLQIGIAHEGPCQSDPLRAGDGAKGRD